MVNVVVTGATSFLGRNLVNELVNSDVHVYAIVRPTSAGVHLFDNLQHVTTVLANMDDVQCWQNEIEKADYFFHLGWDGVGAEGRSNMNIQIK